MSNSQKLVLALVATVALVAAVVQAGTTERPRLYDAQVARIHSGSSFVDVSAAVYTGYTPLLTIEPRGTNALYDAQVTLDLDFGDSSATSFSGGYTSETIRFAVGRKIQGLWRWDTERQSATVAGTAADDRSVTLDLGIVGPSEDCRVYVLLSAEQGDIEIPYVLTYRAGADAVVTEVSN